MFTLIKNAEIFAPEPLGTASVLFCGGTIAWLGKDFPAEKTLPGLKVVEARGMVLMPGIVDGHVHITGGGGEGGGATRTPELLLSDMVRGGVTTVVGLSGTDDVTRSTAALIAKANGLIAEGMSAWAMSGSYQLPIKPVCSTIREDICLIDRIIGVGEIAISDHRSSQPTFEEFIQVAAAARVGGMLGGKSGVVNIHLGDGKSGLDYLFRAAETEIPLSQFMPTHLNRNPDLFEQARKYAAMGGYVDFTSSTIPLFLEEGEVKCSRAVKIMLDDGVPAARISISSDGQGSMPMFNEKGDFTGLTIGRVTANHGEFVDMVGEGIEMEDAVTIVFAAIADHYKLPRKGHIKEGYDADALLLDSSLAIKYVFAKGQMMMEEGQVIVKGTFEN